MAAIGNINNSNLGIIMLRPNAQNIQAVDAKTAKIDREINIKEKYIDTLDNHIKLTKENINLRKEYIQTLQESRDLDKKRIGLMQEQRDLLQNTVDKLQNLLDRKSINVNTSVKVSEMKELDQQLNTLVKKDSALKWQAIAVDTKVEKLATKVEYAEKQLAVFQAKSNDNEISRFQAKQDKTVFTSGYKPSANQLIELEHAKLKQNDGDTKDLDTVLQQRVIYSQKNIYESILNNLLTKII